MFKIFLYSLMWIHRCLPCLQKHRMDKQITILTFIFSFINQLIQYEKSNLQVRLWKNAKFELSNILEIFFLITFF